MLPKRPQRPQVSNIGVLTLHVHAVIRCNTLKRLIWWPAIPALTPGVPFGAKVVVVSRPQADANFWSGWRWVPTPEDVCDVIVGLGHAAHAAASPAAAAVNTAPPAAAVVFAVHSEVPAFRRRRHPHRHLSHGDLITISASVVSVPPRVIVVPPGLEASPATAVVAGDGVRVVKVLVVLLVIAGPPATAGTVSAVMAPLAGVGGIRQAPYTVVAGSPAASSMVSVIFLAIILIAVAILAIIFLAVVIVVSDVVRLWAPGLVRCSVSDAVLSGRELWRNLSHWFLLDHRRWILHLLSPQLVAVCPGNPANHLTLPILDGLEFVFVFGLLRPRARTRTVTHVHSVHERLSICEVWVLRADRMSRQCTC